MQYITKINMTSSKKNISIFFEGFIFKLLKNFVALEQGYFLRIKL